LCTNNPKKDTPEYMIVQCHKTEWLRMAIEKNPFQTSDFVWIDFGIYHMIRDDGLFSTLLENIARKTYSKVRIASCINPNDHCSQDLFCRVAWFFCGSVVGGNQTQLLRFAERMKSKCLSLFAEKKHLTWEVNIWYLLFQENNDIFDFYFADHNPTVLSLY